MKLKFFFLACLAGFSISSCKKATTETTLNSEHLTKDTAYRQKAINEPIKVMGFLE